MKRNDPKRFGILTLLLCSLFAVAGAGEGWTTLFNGKDFEGWEIRGGGDLQPKFEVKDGAIVGHTLVPRNNTAFAATKKSFKDFELLFECKVDEGLNSGVQVRSTAEDNVKGPQVEIEAGSKRTGFIFGQGMGMWLSDDFSDEDTPFKTGEWNRFRVLVKGNTIKTWINDQPVEEMAHEKVFPEGIIALQVHGYPRGKNREKGATEVLSAYWKNIKIREITE